MNDTGNAEDALNAYLDAKAESKAARGQGLDSGLRDGVDDFFDLARRAGVGVRPGRSVTLHRDVSLGDLMAGSDVLQPSGGAAWMPLANGVGARRSSTWMSMAVVALMLLGTVGGAWWFGPGRGDGDEPIRLAAMVQEEATPDGFWPEPLNPVDDPWVAAISTDECTAEPMPYEDYAAAKTTDPGPPTGSYEVVGLPDPADAEAAVTTIRSWTACHELGNQGKIRAYTTDEFLFFLDWSADNQPYQAVLAERRLEASRSFSEWVVNTWFFPLAEVEGVPVPDEAQEIFDFNRQVMEAEATGEAVTAPNGGVVQTNNGGVPYTYFEGRFDPGNAVTLADGRIMVPATYIYWMEDPRVERFGFSTDPNVIVATVILEETDGMWKVDESDVKFCIGDCEQFLEHGMATPVLQPEASPVG